MPDETHFTFTRHTPSKPPHDPSFFRKGVVWISLVAILLTASPPLLSWGLWQSPSERNFFFANDSTQNKTDPPTDQGKRIELIHADTLLFDKEELPDINKLIGNVRLRHEGWIMDCHLALLNEKNNHFDAFGNILIRDDSITIQSQSLYYDGVAKYAKLRNTVELTNDNATLYTDSLDYDRQLGKGYYFTGGTLVDSLNTLTSLYGEYTPDTDEAFFETDVVLENPEYTLYTQRLRYNTHTKIAYFDGATTLIADSLHIESTRGVYDTQNDVAILLDQSRVFHKRGSMTGDSLLYDRKRLFVEAFGNMYLNDTIQQLILRGEYGYFNETSEYGFATVYARAEDYSKEDTLYIAADTLELISRKRSQVVETTRFPPALDTLRPALQEDLKEQNRLLLPTDDGVNKANEETQLASSNKEASLLKESPNSSPIDSGAPISDLSTQSNQARSSEEEESIRLLLAYHRAKLFQKDLQGVADSLAYFTQDSTLSLYQRPIVWSDSIQLEGDTLRAFFAGDTIQRVDAWLNAKAMRQLLDSTIYDQAKGDSLVAFFAEETIRELQLYRNVDMVYFPMQEENKRYFGVGVLKSPKVFTYFATDTIQHALAFGPVDGAIHPIEQASEEIKRLPAMTWEPQTRPLSPEDIVSPLRDSLGNELPFAPIPLSDLARFDGSLATLKAYETIDREILLSEERIREIHRKRIEQQQRIAEALPLYIRRPLETDQSLLPNDFDFDALNREIWPYLEQVENLGNSITTRSITIPEKLPSSEEQKRSETNSSQMES